MHERLDGDYNTDRVRADGPAANFICNQTLMASHQRAFHPVSLRWVLARRSPKAVLDRRLRGGQGGVLVVLYSPAVSH